MIQRFCEVFVWTSDMARAIHFYRDLLGMQMVEEGTQWSTFYPPCADPAQSPIFGIMTTGGAPVPHEAPGPNGVQQGAVFSFTVRNLIEAISKYEAHGLRVIGDMYDDPKWGRCVMFQDPDRNAFMIVERYATPAS